MNNEQVAHSFIYDNDSAQGSNFRFNGNKLYSFNSLMATIDRDRKIILIDERISCYSNSSQKHRRHLLNAIPSTYQVFEWRWQDGKYIECMQNEILGLIDKQSRSKKIDYIPKIKEIISLCNEYDRLFQNDKDSCKNIILDEINSIDLDSISKYKENKTIYS